MSLSIRLECPTCGEAAFRRSPTYNLSPMWRAAGIDWDALEGKTADQVGPVIAAALERLRADPERFQQLTPANGWGSYDNLVEVLDRLVTSCRDFSNFVLALGR